MSKNKSKDNNKRNNIIQRMSKVLPTKDHENDIPYFYVDTKGHVTTAAGFKVDKPSDLYHLEIVDSEGDIIPEEKKQGRIDAEFEHAKQKADKFKEQEGSYNIWHDQYKPSKDEISQGFGIRLSDSAKEKELGVRINRAFEDIRGRYGAADFDELPEDVQMGLTSMTYKMGGAKIIPKTDVEKRQLKDAGLDENGFPNMIKHIRAGDYKAAAKQSNVRSVNAERNKFNFDLFDGADERSEPKKDSVPEKGTAKSLLDQESSLDEVDLPASRFKGVMDRVSGALKAHPKFSEVEAGADLSAEEQQDLEELFHIRLNTSMGKFPKEDMDNEFDHGFTYQNRLVRPFGVVKKQTGQPGPLVLLPDDDVSSADSLHSGASKRSDPSGRSGHSGRSGRERLPSALEAMGRLDLNPDAKPKGGYNPFALQNNNDLDVDFEDAFGAGAEPAVRDAIVDKQSPFHGRVMKNRQRLSERGQKRTPARSRLNPGRSLLG